MPYAILEIVLPLLFLYLVFWLGVHCGERRICRVSWPRRTTIPDRVEHTERLYLAVGSELDTPRVGIVFTFASQGLIVDGRGANPDCLPVMFTWGKLAYHRKRVELPVSGPTDLPA